MKVTKAVPDLSLSQVTWRASACIPPQASSHQIHAARFSNQ